MNKIIAWLAFITLGYNAAVYVSMVAHGIYAELTRRRP